MNQASRLAEPSVVTVRDMTTPRSLRPAGIQSVGYYVPETIVTNRDLESRLDTTDEWIRTRTGIGERRVVREDESVADLCEQAARRALDNAGLCPSDIDLVIVATVSSEFLFPAVSNVIQDRLGIRGGAFDLAAGCTGFAYALTTGCQFVATGSVDRALVIGADILSRMVNWDDRSTCVLFGDGAGAVVVEPVAEGRGLLAFDLGCDGSGGDLLRLPCANHLPLNGQRYITMNGREVFRFAVNIMGESALTALHKCGLTGEDIDCFIPHQANIRIIDSAARRLGIARDKVFVNVEKYGNTSAASIPIALGEALEQGRIHEGDLVVCVGFGAGLTWGSCVLRW